MKNSILIVEDEVKIANLLKDYLDRAGYDTTVLTRGDRVIKQVKKSSPDLILMDLMLPGRA